MLGAQTQPMGQAPLAALLIASASFFFSLMGLCVKMANRLTPTSTFSLLAIRSVIGLLLSPVAMCTPGARCRLELAACGCPESPKLRWWLMLRCVAGFVSITLEYFALQYMRLTTNTMILYSSPIFVTLWCALLFGEPMRLFVLACIGSCFTGLFLIVEPWRGSGLESPWFAYAATLGSTMLAAFVFITLRALKEVDYRVTLNAFLVSCLALSCATGSALGNLPLPPLDSPAWGYLAGVGVCAYAAEVCLTRGYAIAGPAISRVSVLKFLSPVFSAVWAVLLLQERLGVLDCCGAVLILAPSVATLAALHEERGDEGQVEVADLAAAGGGRGCYSGGGSRDR